MRSIVEMEALSIDAHRRYWRYERRAALKRAGQIRQAAAEFVSALLERNGGELAHRELRAWFDRLGFRRPGGVRFYGLLCDLEDAGRVTGRYIVSADGRDRAFALRRPTAGGGRRA